MIGLELSPGHNLGARPGALPLAAFFRAGSGQHVAVAAGADDSLTLWSEVGQNHAACLRLDNDDPTRRYSWRETLITELRNIYAVGEMALTGSWSQLQSSGSGLAGSYTGNRAISTSSLAAKAAVTVDRAAPYDVWVHYTGRTNGAYLRVDIDGGQTRVNEITDPGDLGFKAFSTHHASDLTRRQSVKVASGLTGSHLVEVSVGGVASPGGNAIMLEAIAISGDLSDPRVLPPLWASNTSYSMGDEVQWGGVFYAARANGVSGTVAPTHSGGIASDGALDWRADNRPTYPQFVAIDYASEREYALRFDVDGAFTDLGGQTHGNEVLVARNVELDGATWTPAIAGNGLSVGTQLTVTEDMSWQTQAGTSLGNCQLVRSITPGSIRHDVAFTATGPQADVAWFYAGMLPMVHWDGESASTVVATLDAPEAMVTLADYAGVNPPNINFSGANRLGVTGSVLGQDLHYGHEAGAVPDAANVLDQFNAFLRPNLNARTASGGLDWAAKAYVQADIGAGLSFGSGDVIRFFNRHVMVMES